MHKLNKQQILTDFFKSDDFLDGVPLVWLQNELRIALIQQTELNQCKDTIRKLLFKIDGLEARIELTELLNEKSKFMFDERA
jgi:hypothetical protein